MIVMKFRETSNLLKQFMGNLSKQSVNVITIFSRSLEGD